MMNLVMTSAPVAMLYCHHTIDDATLGLQWHVVGMFAPSFFTGALIARFGTDRVAGVGLAIIAVVRGQKLLPSRSLAPRLALGAATNVFAWMGLTAWRCCGLRWHKLRC